GSYPRRDWQILANDSANGGMERLSVVDVTSGRIPFTIEGNAPANALFVDANGSVGIGTATPTLDLHVTDGNSPALRLEQTTAAGFGPRVWDVGGNEANFFIRDANEGKLPLRIVKKGVDNNLVLREGDVGVGTSAPQASLHVQQKNGDAQLLVEETSETEANRKMFLLKNEGGIEFEMVNTATNGATWFFQNDSNANDPFNISKRGTAGVEMQLNTRRDLLGVATLVIDGSVQATNVQFTSARHRKTAFSAVDADTVLEKVAALPIQTWRYREEANEVRHMGPIAEDFAQAFGLGTSEQHIAMTDLGGVALAAIQGLNARIDTLEARNIELMAQVEALLALAQTATID
ncbi:MAG: tail fiber domain-containing protein, partial [Acidobacteriota bacterium]